MRTRKRYSEGDSVGFDLSISDLMSALCGIFALIMITVVVQLNTTKAEYVAKNQKAKEYSDMQEALYEELKNTFRNDFLFIDEPDQEKSRDSDTEKMGEIEKKLIIRFKDPPNTPADKSIFFDGESAVLKDKFEGYLTTFFPKLIDVLMKEEFKDEIEEIRIEGHTKKIDGDDDDYRTGMELSQERTRNVMIFCLNLLTNDEKNKWVQENIAAIGYSFSRPSKDKNNNTDWDSSRRVEFRIKTKAEAVIEEIQNLKVDDE